jgi:hypothetical protein
MSSSGSTISAAIMNWFVFLYNLNKTEETVKCDEIMVRKDLSSYCLKIDCLKYSSRTVLLLLLTCEMCSEWCLSVRHHSVENKTKTIR